MASLSIMNDQMLSYSITMLDAAGEQVGKPIELQNTVEELVNGVSITTSEGLPGYVQTVNNPFTVTNPMLGSNAIGGVTSNNPLSQGFKVPKPSLEELMEMLTTVAPIAIDTDLQSMMDKYRQYMVAKKVPAAVIEREPSISEEYPRRKIRSL